MTTRPEPKFAFSQRVTHQFSPEIKEYGVIVHYFWNTNTKTWNYYVCFFGTAGFPELGERSLYGQGLYVICAQESKLEPYEADRLSMLPPPCL